MFFRYFKFSLISILKTTFVYISWALYFIMLIFLLYIVPILINRSLSLITSYSHFFLFVVIFVILNSACLITAIFRLPIDNGTEILVISKPLTRSTIIYTKIFLYFILLFLTASLTSIIAYLTQFTNYSDLEIAQKLARDSFIASLIIYLSFGGFALIISMFFKTIPTIIIITSFSTLLMIYTTITSNVFMSIPKYAYRNDKILFSSLSLIEEDNNELVYRWGANGAINNWNNYISDEFYLSEFHQNVPSNKFLKHYYNEISNKNNFNLYLATNFMYQLTALYTWPYSSYFDTSYAILESSLRSSSASNIRMNFVDPNITTNNNLVKISYNNKTYFLSNVLNSKFTNSFDNKVQYLTELTAEKNKSIIQNNKQSLLYLENNKISSINFDKNNLQDLVKFCSLYFKSNSSINEWTTIFAMLKAELALSYFPNLTIDKILNDKVLSSLIFNDLAKEILHFQILSIKSLQNFEAIKNNLVLNEQSANLLKKQLFNSLSYYNNQPKNEILLLFYPISQINNLNPQQIQKYTFKFNPFLYLIDSRLIPTFNYINLSTFYNYNYLIVGWLIFSTLNFLFGIILFFRFNFY